MGHSGSELVVLVPVLKRPHRVKPFLESLEAATPEPHRVLFVADEGDVKEIKAIEEAKADFFTVAPKTSWAQKINAGFHATEESWVFCGADDLDFYEDWFGRAMKWADEKTGVIGTNDLCNDRTLLGIHSTHMLVKRSYIEENGTIDGPGVVHEGYPHEYADDELVQTALMRGVYVHAFDSLVEHLHPLTGKAPDDATYKLGRTFTMRSKRLFHMRARQWRQSPLPVTNRTRPDHR